MDLEQTILKYEIDFLKRDFCKDRYNLEHRIHDEFIEFGQSGCVYDKETIIQYLINLPEDRDIEIFDFVLIQIKEDIVVVHYISTDRKVETKALRNSIWMKKDSNWELYFHQGTPTINSTFK